MAMNENFEVVHEDLYKFINPNITSEKNGIVAFNADLNDNAYPQALVDRYLNSSSIHSNFINLKRRLCYASGFLPEDKENEALVEFINRSNTQGDDSNDVYLKACLDYAIQEMAAVQVIYSADGKVAQIIHTDISKLRAEEPDEFGVINAYWFSKDWTKVNGSLAINDKRFRHKQAVRIPIYNPKNFKEDGRQIMVMKRYTTGNSVYAIPSYNASLNAVDTDFELSQFNINMIKSGFLPSAIISLIGDPSPEEKSKFINEFNRTQTGTANVKALFMWLDNMDNKPEFERMAADPNAKMFDILKKQVVQDISTGHGAALILAGIETGGADLGGDANKLNIARLSFIENVIVDFQRVLLKGFNNIYRHNELGEAMVVNEPLKITQAAQQPTDLTEDERRDLLFGLPPKVEDNNEETINE